MDGYLIVHPMPRASGGQSGAIVKALQRICYARHLLITNSAMQLWLDEDTDTHTRKLHLSHLPAVPSLCRSVLC